MPEFHLIVDGPVVMPPPAAPVGFFELDPFTRGYIEALFFTEGSPAYTSDQWETDECEEAQREGQADGTIPGDVGFSDLSPAALATIIEECAAFQKANAALLAQAYGHDYPARVIGDGTLPDSHRPAWSYDEEAAGRDYWYTRNGHGVGFWDRDLGDVGDKLADAARYDEVNLYFENGQVSIG